MISYYKTVQNHLVECSTPEPGSWVSVVDPTAQERKMLIEEFGLDSDFIKSALDEEESSRVELEDDQALLIVDEHYHQRPVGFYDFSAKQQGD